MIKRGGACLEALQTKGIFGSVAVVEHQSINGLGVYRGIRVYRKEATKGKQINNRANNSITKYNKAIRGARGDLTQGHVILVKGGNIRESIPGVSRFRTDELEGESRELDRLGMCGGRTGCVSGFVSSF